MNPAVAFSYLFPLVTDALNWQVTFDGTNYTIVSFNTAKLGPMPDAAAQLSAFNNATAYYSAVATASWDTAASLAPTLRAALKAVWAKLSDLNKMALVAPTITTAAYFFDHSDDNGGSMQGAIKQLFQSVDLQSDPTLTALRAQILDLPQWTV